MTPLGREIAETIAAEGPMPLDRYMALCLSHPVQGYYARRDPFGARGDFVTAPEISQMFGELIGLWCAEVWRMMGSPARVRLVELGPGRGTLMGDLLRAAQAVPGFRDALDVVLVETSPVLRGIQARTLAGLEPPIRWAADLDGALIQDRHPGRSEAQSRDRRPDEAHLFTPRRIAEASHSDDDPGSTAKAVVRDDGSPLPAVVVANEFFDALPVRQFVRAEGGWRERLVGLSNYGALAFGLSSDVPRDVRLPEAASGAVQEICPHALDIVRRLSAHVSAHGGAALAIDYGYLTGRGDTFQAVRAHVFADPLETPGDADLTAHVDFAALAGAARLGGASVMAPLAQADLLERLGLHERAEALSRSRPDRRDAIAAAVARLTDRAPRGMGALFKALAFGDPRLGALPGFEPAPLRTREIQGSAR